MTPCPLVRTLPTHENRRVRLPPTATRPPKAARPDGYTDTPPKSEVVGHLKGARYVESVQETVAPQPSPGQPSPHTIFLNPPALYPLYRPVLN